MADRGRIGLLFRGLPWPGAWVVTRWRGWGNLSVMLDLKNKRVTVAGLGHFGGGIAAARWLVGQGARVLVTDLAPAEKLRDSVAQLEGVEVEYRLGGHRPEDFTQCDLVVASPAIPPESEYLAAARAAGRAGDDGDSAVPGALSAAGDRGERDQGQEHHDHAAGDDAEEEAPGVAGREHRQVAAV